MVIGFDPLGRSKCFFYEYFGSVFLPSGNEFYLENGSVIYFFWKFIAPRGVPHRLKAP